MADLNQEIKEFEKMSKIRQKAIQKIQGSIQYKIDSVKDDTEKISMMIQDLLAQPSRYQPTSKLPSAGATSYERVNRNLMFSSDKLDDTSQS